MKVPEPRKLDSGTWFIQLRLAGESIPVTALTAKECKDAAALIKAEYLNGKRRQKASSASLTLSEGIDNYISARSNTLSPSTIRGYRYIQKRFGSVMNKPMKSVKNWQAVVNAEAKKYNAKTLKNSWMFVSSVLRENGIDPGKVTLPQVVLENRPWLDPAEITTFINAARGTKGEIPALLALHSLRRSEIAGLTWDKVDLKNKTIRIEGATVYDADNKLVDKETNKNKSSRRTVPIMIPELQVALEAVPDKTGKVVDCSPNSICGRINTLCRQSDLPQVGVHGMRRSFASLGYHLGLSEREVMEMGGWSDTATMHRIYIKLAEADKKKARNKMTKFYENANKNANKQSKST